MMGRRAAITPAAGCYKKMDHIVICSTFLEGRSLSSSNKQITVNGHAGNGLSSNNSGREGLIAMLDL